MRLKLALLMLGMGLVGCKTVPTSAQLVEDDRITLNKASTCCTKLETAIRQPLPMGPVTVDFNASSQAFFFGDKKAFFVLYELPPFTQPYSIALSSTSVGTVDDSAIFVPSMAIYDDQFNVVRYFDEKTLRNRGNRLERTVFINSANQQERFLAVYGSELSVPIERAYAMVTATPVVTGTSTFIMYKGREGKSTLRSSPIGSLRIEVLGLKVAPPKTAK